MDKLTIAVLKDVCKILHIKNISKSKKCNMINNINEKLACLKIQRWFRKKKIGEERCAISLDPIQYPCYAFKPGIGKLNYYNLGTLKNYMIESGNFSDPLSRIQFTEKDLKTMDNIDIYNRRYTHPQVVYVSVLKASKNKNYYAKKHELECEIITFERVLDIITQDIIKFLINDYSEDNMLYTSEDISYTLNIVYLYNYKINIERLYIRDSDHAMYSVSKNIGNFLTIVEQVENKKLLLYNNVIQFLDNVKEELERIN
jgi:hypothetical protein